MIPSQMLKGTLEGCILAIIEGKETYGYEIAKELEFYGFGKIAEGTIYPLLLRLEKNKLLKSILKVSELGPKRKYYSLTEEGRCEMISFFENYNELNKAVNKLIEKSSLKG